MYVRIDDYIECFYDFNKNTKKWNFLIKYAQDIDKWTKL